MHHANNAKKFSTFSTMEMALQVHKNTLIHHTALAQNELLSVEGQSCHFCLVSSIIDNDSFDTQR